MLNNYFDTLKVKLVMLLNPFDQLRLNPSVDVAFLYKLDHLGSFYCLILKLDNYIVPSATLLCRIFLHYCHELIEVTIDFSL